MGKKVIRLAELTADLPYPDLLLQVLLKPSHPASVRNPLPGSLLAVGYSDSGSGLTGFAVQVFVETTGLGTGKNIVSGLFVIRRTAHSPSTNIGIM